MGVRFTALLGEKSFFTCLNLIFICHRFVQPTCPDSFLSLLILTCLGVSPKLVQEFTSQPVLGIPADLVKLGIHLVSALINFRPHFNHESYRLDLFLMDFILVFLQLHPLSSYLIKQFLVQLVRSQAFHVATFD